MVVRQRDAQQDKEAGQAPQGAFHRHRLFPPAEFSQRLLIYIKERHEIIPPFGDRAAF
jgi:hypothetical protein